MPQREWECLLQPTLIERFVIPFPDNSHMRIAEDHAAAPKLNVLYHVIEKCLNLAVN